jgi:hypothetical protein
MRISSTTAFKEWAVVIAALASGNQTLIARKGGISEATGDFELEHNRFWLFPTRFHETEESVVPAYRPLLSQLAAQQGSQVEIEIQYFAVVDSVAQITDVHLLKRLGGRHIWSEHVLEQRFHFGSKPGLHILLTRVYRRGSPIKLPLLPAYGGCRSWITLAEPVAGEVTPVLDDTAFARHREEFHEQFACTHA